MDFPHFRRSLQSKKELPVLKPRSSDTQCRLKRWADCHTIWHNGRLQSYREKASFVKIACLDSHTKDAQHLYLQFAYLLMSLGEIWVKIFRHNAVETRRFSRKLVQRKLLYRVFHSYSPHLLTHLGRGHLNCLNARYRGF